MERYTAWLVGKVSRQLARWLGTLGVVYMLGAIISATHCAPDGTVKSFGPFEWKHPVYGALVIAIWGTVWGFHYLFMDAGKIDPPEPSPSKIKVVKDDLSKEEREIINELRSRRP